MSWVIPTGITLIAGAFWLFLSPSADRSIGGNANGNAAVAGVELTGVALISILAWTAWVASNIAWMPAA